MRVASLQNPNWCPLWTEKKKDFRIFENGKPLVSKKKDGKYESNEHLIDTKKLVVTGLQRQKLCEKLLIQLSNQLDGSIEPFIKKPI